MPDFYSDQGKEILRINLFKNPPKDRHPTHSNGTVKIKDRMVIEPGVYRSTLWENEKYLSFTFEEKLEQSQTQQPAQQQEAGSDETIPF